MTEESTSAHKFFAGSSEHQREEKGERICWFDLESMLSIRDSHQFA
jgi:hypothetical protein